LFPSLSFIVDVLAPAGLFPKRRRIITAVARQRDPGVRVGELLDQGEAQRPHVCEGFGHLILTRLPRMFLQPWYGVMAATINHASYPSQGWTAGGIAWLGT
jgi:hypothetical protein